MSGVPLEALRRIADLPDALGTHACECGHPEMRRLLYGTCHCPSCGSEMLPIDARATLSESDMRGEAWWAGWMDGHFGKSTCFVDNPKLAKWEAQSERLDYHRGHRAGSETRRDRSAPGARARKVEP